MNAKRSGLGAFLGDDGVPGKVFHPQPFQVDQDFFDLPPERMIPILKNQ